MGRFIGPAAVVLAVLHLCGVVQAQQPLWYDPCASTCYQAPVYAYPAPVVPAPAPYYVPAPAPAPVPYLVPAPAPAPYYAPPPPAFDREPPFALELMLGQELGVRGQFAVDVDKRNAIVVEGFYGALFSDIGSAQTLGAGGRWLLTENGLTANDSLVFGPGVDVFFGLNHRALILLTPSIDLEWEFRLGSSFEWLVGLDIGLGIGMSGHTDHGNSAIGDLSPLISLYTGIKF